MYSQVMKSLTDNTLFVQTTQIPKRVYKRDGDYTIGKSVISKVARLTMVTNSL